MSLALVDCGEEWMPPLRSFLSRAYSPEYRLVRDGEFFRWQFGRGGERGCRFKLVVDGEAVRACLGYVPVELSIAGATVPAAWTANWMVEPSARRLGLGPLLLRALMREFEAVLSVGVAPDAAAILPRMGWADFGPLERFICVLDTTGARRLAGNHAPAFVAAAEVPRPPVRARCGFDELEAGEVDRLWTGTWGQHGAGTRRSLAFLRWRYAEHPVWRHDVLGVRDGQGRLTGLAVSRLERVRGESVTVVRLLELIAEASVAASVASAVVAHARGAGAALVDFFCASRAFTLPLRDAGFESAGRGALAALPYLYQPLDRARTGIRFMACTRRIGAVPADQWYVTKADGDQDRPN